MQLVVKTSDDMTEQTRIYKITRKTVNGLNNAIVTLPIKWVKYAKSGFFFVMFSPKLPQKPYLM